jgi:hypothetical protein
MAAEFGIENLPDYADRYSRSIDKHSVSAAVTAGLTQGWKKVEAPSAGSLVILKVAGRPWHCAIAVNDAWFLHTLSGVNACLERFDSMVWNGRIEGFYERN